MTWTEIVSILGIGSILGIVISKLFDILWLQKTVMKNESIRWIRDQRLRVFRELSGDFATLGLRDSRKDILEIVAVASEATLLRDDEVLKERIMKCTDDLCSLREGPGAQADENDKQEINRLVSEGRSITESLRGALMDDTLTKLIIDNNRLHRIARKSGSRCPATLDQSFQTQILKIFHPPSVLTRRCCVSCSSFGPRPPVSSAYLWGNALPE